MGLVGGSYHPAGGNLCFHHVSISNCKERILVAGLHTGLVRGTKTGREERKRGERGVGLLDCQIR